MTINELSIGDWVRYRDREWMVCSLYQFTEEVGLWRKDSQLCEYITDIEPVPLTPEILKKNGFECIEIGDKGPATPKQNYLRYEHWQGETMWGRRDLFYDRLTKMWRFGGMNEYRFDTVHRLQHAIRFSGWDKEIEL